MYYVCIRGYLQKEFDTVPHGHGQGFFGSPAHVIIILCYTCACV